ncbi:MAG: DUF3343 domain-containing protein [Atopobiaceae bacterium]|jgi:hypothetical protein
MPLSPKKNTLIVAFDRTTDAMAMETACERDGIPGRIIPMPPQISAGCGMVWKADPSDKKVILDEVVKIDLTPSGVYEIML